MLHDNSGRCFIVHKNPAPFVCHMSLIWVTRVSHIEHNLERGKFILKPFLWESKVPKGLQEKAFWSNRNCHRANPTNTHTHTENVALSQSKAVMLREVCTISGSRALQDSQQIRSGVKGRTQCRHISIDGEVVKRPSRRLGEKDSF